MIRQGDSDRGGIADIGELAALRRDVAIDAAARPGDEEMIARMAQAAALPVEVAPPHRMPRRWLPMAVAAGAIVVVSAVAGAAIWEGARRVIVSPRAAAPSSPTRQPQHWSSDSVRDSVRAPAPEPVPVAAAVPAVPSPAPAVVSFPSGRTVPRTRSERPPIAFSAAANSNGKIDASAFTDPARSPAAVLFAEATRLRRQGDYRAAATAYQRLQREFPGAREDLTTRVILGQLMLDRFDQPQRGVALFESYLADQPDGALAEDARFGRATALRRSGQPGQERAAWQELLRAHPRSVYAPEARRRLAELP